MFKPSKLKYHSYFISSVILRRPYLTEEKILKVLNNFEDKEVQENGRIAYHAYDEESQKFLKVIVEVDKGEQVIFNAYFNRSYKRKNDGEVI